MRFKYCFKKSISFILVLVMLSGCAFSEGEKNESQIENEEELIEPVGTVLNYTTAEIRDLAKVSTYQGIVCPNTVQYSYESDQSFGNYNFLPGDSVLTGDVLFYGSIGDIDDSIDEIEESNVTLLTGYNDYEADYMIDVAKARTKEFETASAYQDLLKYAPAEDSSGYIGWAKGAMPAESAYKSAKMAREKLEAEYLEKTQLFEMEYEYNTTRISRLEEEKAKGGVESTIDGVVVATNYYMSGDSIPMGSDIIAVGDPNDKEIICDYISKSVINKAAEVYALIDGEKVDVVYENMDPEEYRRLKQKDEDVYTTFKIPDQSGSIAFGKYAVIVVVESLTLNALCVPKDAVNKDDTGTYVYLYENGDSVYTPVTVGESDNGFCEIKSGLKEGDKVVYDADYDLGSNSDTVKSGSVSTDFSAYGYLMYPKAEWMYNPAKNGVCYLNELCVERFEQIEEGQTLAKVEVVTDSIETDRINRKIQRQNERIADLNEKRKTTYDKDALETIDRAIRNRNRTLEELNKQLEKLNKYSGIVEIKAPYSGIVTDITETKPGEIINYKDNILRIAPDDSCYILVEDKNSVLSYGDECTVSVTVQSEKYETEGTIVSLNPCGLTGALKTEYALAKIPLEAMSLLTDSGSDNANGYWARIRLNVSCVARSMENVLLIPKNAVVKIGNNTYVQVKNDDGTSKLVSFVAGGSDNANYWVAYGDISEGMTICWG
ncbi:MAG: HlyD family efflux transporter periplasmic adaptor subunit [Lachnospiraceae bacterium]|nr:HlyD family efflux transporter periplasmic adaptor subunit [Lachnospiraceae bacterium]